MIDTSLFVNAVEEHEIDHAFSRQFLSVVRARQVALILPALVTVEVAGQLVACAILFAHSSLSRYCYDYNE